MRGRYSRCALGLSLLVATGCATSSASPSISAAPSSSAAGSAEGTPTPAASATSAGWRELQATGELPAAREDHTWTITPDARTAFLYGGRGGDGAPLGDLWAYDLPTNAWTLLTRDGPPARFGHNAAWVDGVGLVIFAGQSGATFYNDLWAFDPATARWQQLPAGGAAPVPRYGSCAAIGPDGRLWISHGFTQGGQRFADTRAYDFSTQSWTDETPAGMAPVQRCLHGCWWTGLGTFVLYAGQTTGTNSLGDLWQLTVGERPGTNSWGELSPDEGLPPARNLYAAARLEGRTLIFGGQAVDGSALDDTWSILDSGRVVTGLTVGEAPPARWGAELVADPTHDRLLLFGGRDGDGPGNDLWELTLVNPGG
jgi:galactose oxidase-like protein